MEAKTLIIERLTLSGFGRFGAVQSWELGRMTTVTGHNYQGKSTIADAIAFALTGAPYFGGRDLDRLHHPDKALLEVELAVRTEEGQTHVIRRIRQDNKVTVAVDGAETTQARFAARFGSKDIILSLLNPFYFAEVLEADGRKLIEEFLPPVTHEAVLEQLSEPMRKALGDDNLGTPEIYLKNRRDELKTLEKDRLILEGQAEQTDASRGSLQNELAEKQTLLEHTRAALSPLEQKQATLDCTSLDAEIARLSAQYDATQAGSSAAQQPLIQELSALKQKRYQSVNEKRLGEMQAYLARQYARYQDEQARFAALQAKGVCPTCLRRIDTGSLPEIQQAFSARLGKIQQDGVTVRGQYEQLAAQDAMQHKQFVDWQTAETTRLEQALKASPVNNAAEQRQALKSKIKELSAKRALGALTADEARRYQALFQQQSKLESEIGQIEKMLAGLPNGQRQALDDIDAQIKATQEKIAAAKSYLSERTALLFAPVKMNKTGLRFYEAVKETGEMRDVFKLTYDGRDYAQLSFSERMRCGREVVELLSALSGKCYPLFVDNTESFCDLGTAKPAGQLILSRVVRGQTLQVRNMDTQQQKAS